METLKEMVKKSESIRGITYFNQTDAHLFEIRLTHVDGALDVAVMQNILDEMGCPTGFTVNKTDREWFLYRMKKIRQAREKFVLRRDDIDWDNLGGEYYDLQIV